MYKNARRFQDNKCFFNIVSPSYILNLIIFVLYFEIYVKMKKMEKSLEKSTFSIIVEL